MPEWAFLGLGYSGFLWASLVLIDPGLVTPDLLVAAIVFLISGYLVEVARSRILWGVCDVRRVVRNSLPGQGNHVSIGIWIPWNSSVVRQVVEEKDLWRFIVRPAVLDCKFAFYHSSLEQKGRLTFGDSGRLNYASLVNPGAPQVHWQGEPVGSGTPRHTTRGF